MAEPLLRALTRMRGLVLDEQTLLRAVASGRQKGEQPRWRRVELRYVDLKAGRRLQVRAYDETARRRVCSSRTRPRIRVSARRSGSVIAQPLSTAVSTTMRMSPARATGITRRR